MPFSAQIRHAYTHIKWARPRIGQALRATRTHLRLRRTWCHWDTLAKTATSSSKNKMPSPELISVWEIQKAKKITAGEAASLIKPPFTTYIDSPAAQARHHHLGWASFASDASTSIAVRLTRWCALERDENQLTSCKISSKISAAVASVSSEKGSSARTCPSARRAASRMSGMPRGARNGGDSNAVWRCKM